jgi:hypothetical protein
MQFSQKIVQILYGLGSVSGPGQLDKPDPDPDKIRPDLQLWDLEHCSHQNMHCSRNL